jgi:hypothetical protein
MLCQPLLALITQRPPRCARVDEYQGHLLLFGVFQRWNSSCDVATEYVIILEPPQHAAWWYGDSTLALLAARWQVGLLIGTIGTPRSFTESLAGILGVNTRLPSLRHLHTRPTGREQPYSYITDNRPPPPNLSRHTGTQANLGHHPPPTQTGIFVTGTRSSPLPTLDPPPSLVHALIVAPCRSRPWLPVRRLPIVCSCRLP